MEQGARFRDQHALQARQQGPDVPSTPSSRSASSVPAGRQRSAITDRDPRPDRAEGWSPKTTRTARRCPRFKRGGLHPVFLLRFPAAWKVYDEIPLKKWGTRRDLPGSDRRASEEITGGRPWFVRPRPAQGRRNDEVDGEDATSPSERSTRSQQGGGALLGLVVRRRG